MKQQMHEINDAQVRLIEEIAPEAAIFDLDGTILDNNPYHVKTWRQYLQRENRDLSKEEFNEHLNGRTNEDAIRYLYGEHLPHEEVNRLIEEKEKLYREIYKEHIQPLEGLYPLLELLRRQNIPMAIATSGIVPNIEFMFEHVPIRQYFEVVVHSGHITHGKPHPEMYLKTASMMNQYPQKCLVFEDSTAGIQSAKAAGMRVIALSTTHAREELLGADYITSNFTFQDIQPTQ